MRYVDMKVVTLAVSVIVAVGASSPAMALKCAYIEFEIHARVVDATRGAVLPGAKVVFHWNRREHPATGPGPTYRDSFEANDRGEVVANLLFFYKGVWGPFGGHCSGKPKLLRVTVTTQDRRQVVQKFKLGELEIVERGQVRVVELPLIGVTAT